MHRRLAGLIVSAVTLLGPMPASHAAEYPSQMIRVIVGPGPDLVARLFGPAITDVLGQQVVIEPRPGAGGLIAQQAVAAAPPDGYTLLLASASYTINTALQTSPLDMHKDFTPVALATTSPFVLVVHPSVPVRTVAELIALAKAKPGQLNYASAGLGTPPHLAGELFKLMAGVDIVHVPFREANSALNAVISGSVQMMFSIATTAQSQMAGGTVRGLGVTTAAATRLVPGVPPMADVLPGYDVTGWNGLVAPRGTPAAVVDKLNGALQRGLEDNGLREKLAAAGYEPARQNQPQDFARFMAADTEKWLALVEKTQMRAK